MSLSSFDDYVALLNLGIASDFQMSSATTGAVARLCDISFRLVPAPLIPSTAVALDRTSDLAINTPVARSSGAGTTRILGARVNPSGLSGVSLFFCDYLAVSGGMSGIDVTEQTTNLPSAALTRHTSGEGVKSAIRINATVGTTNVVATVSYTNQSGTAGRTGTTYVGATGFREVGRILPITLEGGDTGVRSVESVTLSATTGAAGNFGILLYKPLAMMCLNNAEGANVIDAVSSGGFIGAFAEVDDDACLSMMAVWPVAQILTGAVLMGEA